MLSRGGAQPSLGRGKGLAESPTRQVKNRFLSGRAPVPASARSRLIFHKFGKQGQTSFPHFMERSRRRQNDRALLHFTAPFPSPQPQQTLRQPQQSQAANAVGHKRDQSHAGRSDRITRGSSSIFIIAKSAEPASLSEAPMCQTTSSTIRNRSCDFL